MVDNKGHPIVIMGGGIKQTLEKALKEYLEYRLYGETKGNFGIYEFLSGKDYGKDQIYTTESYEPKKKDI